jgi:hypothetical protein
MDAVEIDRFSDNKEWLQNAIYVKFEVYYAMQ